MLDRVFLDVEILESHYIGDEDNGFVPSWPQDWKYTRFPLLILWRPHFDRANMENLDEVF